MKGAWRIEASQTLRFLQLSPAEIRPLCVALSEAYLTRRSPGFDLDDPDWPALRVQFNALTALTATTRSRLRSAP